MRITNYNWAWGSERAYTPSTHTVHSKWGDSLADMDIRKVEAALAQPTSVNRKWCFYNDTTTFSFGCMSASVLAGKKLPIEAVRLRDQKKVDAFSRRVNFQNDTIEDLVGYFWIDNLIEGNAFWRPWKTNELKSGLDLSRVDPASLRHMVHPTRGYSVYVQEAREYIDTNVSSVDSFVEKLAERRMEPLKKRVSVYIPDRIENMLKVKLFDYPPMAGVVPLVVQKKWIMWFMRKHAQKNWAPFTVFKLGSDKYMPLEGEYLKAKESLDQQIPNMYNFSGMAIPGWIDPISMNLSQGSEFYIVPLDWINSEIMNALHGSMNQRSTTRLTGRTTMDESSRIWLADMEGHQASMDIKLRELFAHVLTDNGDPDDFTIYWPDVHPDTIIDLTVAAANASSIGVMSDVEVRRAIQMAYDFVQPDEKVTPAATTEERKLKLQEKMQKAQPEHQSGENKDLGEQRDGSKKDVRAGKDGIPR